MRKNKVKCLFGFHDFKEVRAKEVDAGFGYSTRITSKCVRCKLKTNHWEWFYEFSLKRPNLTKFQKFGVKYCPFGVRI